jgi:hypothetical protein
MSSDSKANPPPLKGEVSAFVGVAVLPVRDHDSDADDDDINPVSPVQGRRPSWGRGLMKSARSSIEVRSFILATDVGVLRGPLRSEATLDWHWLVASLTCALISRLTARRRQQPRTYDDTSPPPALVSASRSYYTSQWRTNTAINLVHIVDLNQPAPSAEVLAAKSTAAQEVDATGGRTHVYLASRQERVKAVLGVVGKDELGEGEKRERVRIVCKSDQWTATAEIVRCLSAPRSFTRPTTYADLNRTLLRWRGQAQRYPADQPFSLTVRSIHQQAFVVLPRSFRGPVHFSTNSGSVILSAGVGAAYTHISKHYGFLGPIEGWSQDQTKVDDEGLDECWASSDVARVHVRFDDEEPELDPLEEAAKKAGQTAKKVSSWFRSALDKI